MKKIITKFLNRVLRRKAAAIIGAKQAKIERVVAVQSAAIDEVVTSETAAIRNLMAVALKKAAALSDTGVLSPKANSGLGNVRLSLAATVGAI